MRSLGAVLGSWGVSLQIIRPGGMERPTDSYKETHNLRLVPADTLTGGQVSALQVRPGCTRRSPLLYYPPLPCYPGMPVSSLGASSACCNSPKSSPRGVAVY